MDMQAEATYKQINLWIWYFCLRTNIGNPQIFGIWSTKSNKGSTKSNKYIIKWNKESKKSNRYTIKSNKKSTKSNKDTTKFHCTNLALSLMATNVRGWRRHWRKLRGPGGTLVDGDGTGDLVGINESTVSLMRTLPLYILFIFAS